MSHKSLFGRASHLENIGSWKAGSPASNPRRLKPFFAAVIEEHNQYAVYCNNSWRPQLRDQTLCFTAWDWSFFSSCNEEMGMMQPYCRADGAYCRSQEPQASGREWMLGIPKRNGGNGFLRQINMSHKSLFGRASHFANIGSWKAGSPTSNPLLLKAQSRQLLTGLQQSHVTSESTINIR